jgi:hypothetical protein
VGQCTYDASTLYTKGKKADQNGRITLGPLGLYRHQRSKVKALKPRACGIKAAGL